MAEKTGSPGAGVKTPANYNLSEEAKKKLAEAMAGQNPRLKAALDANKKRMELQKKIAEEMKSLFDKTEKDSKKFVSDIYKKYKKEIIGIVIVPPKPPAPGSKPEKKNLNPELFVILDIKKGANIQEKIKGATPVFKSIIEKAKKDIAPIRVNPILIDEVWETCLKGHHEVLRLITSGRIVKDSGWLMALRAVELHKNLVLSRLDKYVISYIAAGSLIRGQAEATSDLDVFIIIDDTDVTKMTSAELQGKLRNMIYSMIFDVESKLKIKSGIHPQVWVLTDFWNGLRNANPVFFTVVRDGIPLYDRGMFAPWRLLIKKGKVTPTPEAVDNYLKSGNLALKRISQKFRGIIMEDVHWAVSTPTQGIFMLLGFPPLAPKEVSQKMREHLVKPGLLEEKYVKLWDTLLKLYKDLEHQKVKTVTAEQVMEHTKKAEEYIQRLEKLFNTLDKTKVQEATQSLYDKTVEDAQAVIRLIGGKADKKNIVNALQNEVVKKNLAPKRYLELVKKVIEIKEHSETTRQEVATLEFEENHLFKSTIELINAEKGRKGEKFKFVAKYSGDTKTANIWLFGDEVHILSNVNKKTPDIKRYTITKDGKLQDPRASSIKLIEKKLATHSGQTTNITDATLRSLKTILGNDIKLVIG